jgi:sec-independent protein translocase protein TatA
MDLGWPEILIILVVILLVFGPGKLPEVGTALGKTIHSFRKAQRGDDLPKAAAIVNSGSNARSSSDNNTLPD